VPALNPFQNFNQCGSCKFLREFDRQAASKISDIYPEFGSVAFLYLGGYVRKGPDLRAEENPCLNSVDQLNSDAEMLKRLRRQW
jgi:hypothetical protein